jgi:hypothetical protein
VLALAAHNAVLHHRHSNIPYIRYNLRLNRGTILSHHRHNHYTHLQMYNSQLQPLKATMPK